MVDWLTVAILATHPLVMAAVAFSLLTLGLAFFAALGFMRGTPKPRYRRTPQRHGGGTSPEDVPPPFPNLLGK